MENTRKFRALLCAAASLFAAVTFGGAAQAGVIVVNHDEWTLSNTGFSQAPDTATFVANLVSEFGSTIHAYSANFGFTGSALATAMANEGATYTTGTSFDFTLANISAFDTILLGGFYLDTDALSALTAFVAAGGSVYIAGGTGAGGPATEAAAWNDFLSPFGIQMNSSSYNGVSGVLAISGDPIFDGVSGLYQNNGSMLTGASVVCCGPSGPEGLFAVHRLENMPSEIPIPAALPLFLAGIGGLSLIMRRRKSGR